MASVSSGTPSSHSLFPFKLRLPPLPSLPSFLFAGPAPRSPADEPPACVARKASKKSGLFRRDPRRHSLAGSAAEAKRATVPARDYFEDEADLFADVAPKPGGSSGECPLDACPTVVSFGEPFFRFAGPESNGTSLSDDDAGVFVASSGASLSPTPSAERHATFRRRGFHNR
jgi:hypothetical protein